MTGKSPGSGSNQTNVHLSIKPGVTRVKKTGATGGVSMKRPDGLKKSAKSPQIPRSQDMA